MNKLFSYFQELFFHDFSWIPSSLERATAPPDPRHEHFSAFLTGKLLLRNEIPLDNESFQQMESSELLATIPAIEKHPWGYKCRRCGNRKRHLFASLPDGAVYCRNCIMMGRVSEKEHLYAYRPDVQWPKHVDACQWNGELTPAQQHAANQILSAIGKDSLRLLVWAVCGAGKTEMLFPGLNLAFAQGKRVCLATPRADVVQELLPRFQSAFPSVEIQALHGTSDDKSGSAPFIIATTHQLLRFGRAFDVMIIDEIDAFPFHKDKSLTYAADRATKETAARIYLTATPRPKHEREIARKRLPVVFVPRRFHGHPLPVPQFITAFDFRKTLKHRELSPKILNWLKKRVNADRQLLIFVPTIEDAVIVTDILSFYIPSITSVHASDPERSQKIQSFRDKSYETLVTTTILERGVTFPSVDVLVFDSGHHVFDQAALIQIAGRAGRSPDDPDGEVIFFHQGKTEAMVKAVETIWKMNKLGRRM
ncbi:DEAD/DEAH box helicase [Thalassobacillus sp. B23F22_16]|uniref:DEAD/DEAH box helicase n=1 Tax=Thalassobacillus sp. B23F22_16 TaxID=3459513 RepID=UPI00373E8438